jgi:hypothetical protein
MTGHIDLVAIVLLALGGGAAYAVYRNERLGAALLVGATVVTLFWLLLIPTGSPPPPGSWRARYVPAPRHRNCRRSRPTPDSRRAAPRVSSRRSWRRYSPVSNRRPPAADRAPASGAGALMRVPTRGAGVSAVTAVVTAPVTVAVTPGWSAPGAGSLSRAPVGASTRWAPDSPLRRITYLRSSHGRRSPGAAPGRCPGRALRAAAACRRRGRPRPGGASRTGGTWPGLPARVSQGSSRRAGVRAPAPCAPDQRPVSASPAAGPGQVVEQLGRQVVEQLVGPLVRQVEGQPAPTEAPREVVGVPGSPA